MNKYVNFITSYKTTKTSLKSILKWDNLKEKIEDAVNITNKIIIYTLQFIKMYYLYKLETAGIYIGIDKKIVNTIMKIICERSAQGRKAKDNNTAQDLKDFYNSYFKKCMIDMKLSYKRLNTVLDYETISILTMYKNKYSVLIHAPRRYRYASLLAHIFTEQQYTQLPWWAKRLFMEIPFVEKPWHLLLRKCVYRQQKIFGT